MADHSAVRWPAANRAPWVGLSWARGQERGLLGGMIVSGSRQLTFGQGLQALSRAQLRLTQQHKGIEYVVGLRGAPLHAGQKDRYRMCDLWLPGDEEVQSLLLSGGCLLGRERMARQALEQPLRVGFKHARRKVLPP